VDIQIFRLQTAAIRIKLGQKFFGRLGYGYFFASQTNEGRQYIQKIARK
jgi:hypothetical protein